MPGREYPQVSGSTRAATPPRQQQQPMIMNGSRGSVADRDAMVGANRPPILAEVEHNPIAEFLDNKINS